MLGDDPSTAQPDEVFGIFDAFLISMGEARQENLAIRKRKEEEERRVLQEIEVRLYSPIIRGNYFTIRSDFVY